MASRLLTVARISPISDDPKCKSAFLRTLVMRFLFSEGFTRSIDSASDKRIQLVVIFLSRMFLFLALPISRFIMQGLNKLIFRLAVGKATEGENMKKKLSLSIFIPILILKPQNATISAELFPIVLTFIIAIAQIEFPFQCRDLLRIS